MTDGASDKGNWCGNTDPDSVCKGIVPHDMFEILMNGVFAFVMTLIVRNNIPLPPLSASDDLEFLREYIGMVSGDLVGFFFVFVIFAVFYILFFEMLRNIRTLDRYFVYISFFFALSLIFMPLTSLLYMISDMPIPYGVSFHANTLLSGLIMFVLWRHASRGQNLLYTGTDPALVKNISLRLLLFPVTAAAGLFLDSWVVSFGLIPDTILYAIPCIAFVLLSRDS
jgi:uncharacterized membrane protein